MTSLAWLALCVSCAMPSCNKPRALSSSSASAAPNVARRPPARCTLELGSDRQATRDELLGLILPGFRAGDGALPVQHPLASRDRPDVSGVFLVPLCGGQALESLSPPTIGELQRLDLGDGRELVQFPVGTQEGLDVYTVGVLAILGREGPVLRVLGTSEAAADRPGVLTPFRRASVGSEALLMRSEVTNPAGEDRERGQFVSLFRVQGHALEPVGLIWERRESDATFWQGAFDWQMTSPGV